jgi:hypothetical protein
MPAMTTIRPNSVPHLFADDAPDVHRVFAAQEFAGRDEAERVARKMMEEYEADHSRQVFSVGERIDRGRRLEVVLNIKVWPRPDLREPHDQKRGDGAEEQRQQPPQ